MQFLRSKIEKEIDTIHIFSDGCAAQFRSRYVFCFLTEIQKDVDIVWHYFEAHHDKGPMDGIGDTIKNMVFKKVLSSSTVINTPKEFAEFANTVSAIFCLYFPNEDLLQEPDHVKIVHQYPIPYKRTRLCGVTHQRVCPVTSFSISVTMRTLILCNVMILLAVIRRMKSMTTHAAIV